MPTQSVQNRPKNGACPTYARANTIVSWARCLRKVSRDSVSVFA
jgi:hypothetical protein